MLPVMTSGCAQAPFTPPGGGGLQKGAAAPKLQTTSRTKPIEDGPQITCVDRGAGGVSEAVLQDGNPSGGLCP